MSYKQLPWKFWLKSLSSHRSWRLKNLSRAWCNTESQKFHPAGWECRSRDVWPVRRSLNSVDIWKVGPANRLWKDLQPAGNTIPSYPAHWIALNKQRYNWIKHCILYKRNFFFFYLPSQLTDAISERARSDINSFSEYSLLRLFAELWCCIEEWPLPKIHDQFDGICCDPCWTISTPIQSSRRRDSSS